MPEKHHHDEQQTIHRKRARKVRPLQAKRMPFQVVHRTQEGHYHHDGKKTFRVKQALHPTPIPPNQRAKQEEVEISHHLNKARVLKESILVIRKPRRHIQRSIHRRCPRPQQENRHNRLPRQFAFKVRKHIIHHKHQEQRPSKPIPRLRGRKQRRLKPLHEVRTHQREKHGEKHHRRNQLHPAFLQQILAQCAQVPFHLATIRQEARDKEEERHAEKHKKRKRRRMLNILRKTIGRHMIRHHKNHRKPTHGVQPLHTRTLVKF